MKTQRYYAGIGSRETPDEITTEMRKLGTMLEACDYTLRSGNATGADQAFAAGVKEKAQIWLPRKDFEKKFQNAHPNHEYRLVSPLDVEAYKSVLLHPNALNLSESTCQFMARNYRQVIGLDEPNSEFIICWTPQGAMLGGTAQALRLAKKYNIMVVNMFEYPTAQEVVARLALFHEIN